MSLRVLNYKIHKPLPPRSIYVGRANRFGCAGTFGNKHTPGRCEHCTTKLGVKTSHTKAECLRLFSSEFFFEVETNAEYRSLVVGLLKFDFLVCGCVDKDGNGPCHARIEADFLNSLALPAEEHEVIEAARAARLALAADAVEANDHGR